MRVYVYFNLHKKCFSVKALEGENKGRVIAHSQEICLRDVTFKVSEAGRQRVLATKRKNVHAGVVGTVANWVDAPYDNNGQAVGYNPYKYDSFVTLDGGTCNVSVKRAKFAVLMHKKILAWGIE